MKQSYEKALKYLKILAAQGNPLFLYQLGIYFGKGLGGLERSYEKAFKLLKFAADQGYAPAILELSYYYQHGRYVKESYEEAARYLKLGAQSNDPECLFKLAHFYEKGWGNIIPSFFDALKCYRLAADLGHREAKKKIASINQVFNLNAQRVNLIDQDLSTLKAVFQNYEKEPIFLEVKDLSSTEIPVIRDAMIENPHFTFICPEDLIEQLFIAFESIGYRREEDLLYGFLTSPTNQPRLMGCVFIQDEVAMH